MAKQFKKKVYVLIVSRFYPGTHPLKGQPTNFPELIINEGKRHTVRANYKLWAGRAIEVQAGRAVISLRFWTGRPYNSNQQEFAELSHIHVQKVHIYHIRRSDYIDNMTAGPRTYIFIDNSYKPLQHPFKFAANDGLTMPAFLGWFKKPVEDAALIHFTNFKY